MNAGDDGSPDQFAADYQALRRQEGWAGPDGTEEPDRGNPRLWAGRVRSVSRASAVLARLEAGGRRPLIVDAGAGSGWPARFLTAADVVGIDLVVPPNPSKLMVRGDIRNLPIRNGAIDGILFAASLHYAEPSELIPEAARILRKGGMLVAIDSPIYKNRLSQRAAAIRSSSYYSKAGFPRLAHRYHPLEAGELRTILLRAGFRIDQWRIGSWLTRLWNRFARRPPSTFVVATKL